MEEAVRLAPAVFDYRYRLGSAYLELGRYEQATIELEKAVSIDKTQIAAWTTLGQARNGYADDYLNGPLTNVKRCWHTIPQMRQPR